MTQNINENNNNQNDNLPANTPEQNNQPNNGNLSGNGNQSGANPQNGPGNQPAQTNPFDQWNNPQGNQAGAGNQQFFNGQQTFNGQPGAGAQAAAGNQQPGNQQSSNAQPGQNFQPNQPVLSKKEQKKRAKLEQAKARTTEEWMKREKKIAIIFSIVCAVLLILTIVGFSKYSSEKKFAQWLVAQNPEYALSEDTSSTDEDFLENATAGQKNAYQSALSYLNSGAFSKSGLVEQLEYEKYSKDDAEWAVDHLDVNWKEEAVKSAKEYLATDSFSHDGLVEQLEYEGFTAEQAEYGVSQAGL